MRLIVFFTLVFSFCITTVFGQLKMDSNGNIGVGTTLPSSRLEVNNGDLTIVAGPSSATDPGDLIFRSAAGDEYGRIFTFHNAMRFRANSSSNGSFNIMHNTGYVAVNQSSASVPLDVNGIGRAHVWMTYSDPRLKSEIDELSTSRVNDLYSLSGYAYKLHTKDESAADNPEEAGKTYVKSEIGEPSIGLMADEIQKVYPELVVEADNGMLSVNYDGLLPIVIEALKMQENRIAELESQIRALDIREGAGNSGQMANQIGEILSIAPNPFSNETSIRCKIEAGHTKAAISFFNMDGQQMRYISLDPETGEAEVSLKGENLQSGLYTVSLIVDGWVVDTERVVIQK